MRYGAITLDTQAFVSNHFNFDTGILAQVKQLKESSIAVLLTDIVTREMTSRLAQNITVAKERFEAQHKSAVSLGLLATDSKAFDGSNPFPRKIAKDRIAAYVEEIGAQIVSSDEIPMRALTDLYFKSQPPFAVSGKKKNEFPDAISLLTLQAWAEKNETVILAVTGDEDWATFAEKSEQIDTVQTLAEALALFQAHAEEAKSLVQTLMQRMVGGQSPTLENQLFDRISSKLSEITIQADADSDHYAEPGMVEVELQEYEFGTNGGGYDVTIVHAERGQIVAQIELEAAVNLSTRFRFSVIDDEGDNISVGSTNAQISHQMEVSVLATFVGDFSTGDVQLDDLDIVSASPRWVHFGYVALEPEEAWSDDDEGEEVSEHRAE